jgi:hypothetical protein
LVKAANFNECNMSTIDADKVKTVLELVIGKMRALETELVAYAAVFLALRQKLQAGQELDDLLDAARKSPHFSTMIPERYAPLYAALEQWNKEDSLLQLLKNWEYPGPKQ